MSTAVLARHQCSPTDTPQHCSGGFLLFGAADQFSLNQTIPKSFSLEVSESVRCLVVEALRKQLQAICYQLSVPCENFGDPDAKT